MLQKIQTNKPTNTDTYYIKYCKLKRTIDIPMLLTQTHTQKKIRKKYNYFDTGANILAYTASVALRSTAPIVVHHSPVTLCCTLSLVQVIMYFLKELYGFIHKIIISTEELEFLSLKISNSNAQFAVCTGYVIKSLLNFHINFHKAIESPYKSLFINLA